MNARFRHAYLHGFASSPLSRKGLQLRDAFRRAGVELELPDLNVPTFETLTYSAILEALDRLLDTTDEPATRWRLVGSSMGGYLTARWAQLRPRSVDRVVLLCPGFDMAERWPEVLGAETVARWEREGALELPDAEGRPRPVHWELLVDARRHPPFPALPCPGLIVHGRRDEIVDPAVSRRYARQRPDVRLVEVDDDHSLAGSLDRVAAETLRFFELESRAAGLDNVVEGNATKGGRA